MGFELTTLVMISTDCIGSCNSNHYMIMTTTAPEICIWNWDRGGHDRMVVGFTTIYAISAYYHKSHELESCWWWGVLDTTLCQWHSIQHYVSDTLYNIMSVTLYTTLCQWYSMVSSTNKTHCNDINWNIVESAIKHYTSNPTLTQKLFF